MSTYKVPGISEQKLIYPNHPVDWIIHLVKNGNVCEECGDVEMGLLPNACNSHTHGMERYNHLNFQLVLNYSNEEIMRILNTLGCMVRDGFRFEDGDLIEGIYLDCPVKLKLFNETERSVLRVIVPDKYNKFPEEAGCMVEYLIQNLETDDLFLEHLKSTVEGGIS